MYASLVELEGTVDDDRPASAFSLKLNGKNIGAPQAMKRFQSAGDPLDLVLIVESSSLYGPQAAPTAGAAPATPPPPPVKTKKGPVTKKEKDQKNAKTKNPFKLAAATSNGDEPLDYVKEAATDLLSSMPSNWHVLLIDYGSDVTPHIPWRAPGAVAGAIDDLSADGDGADLRLVQAIDKALLELNKPQKEGAKPSRRLIVLISDGMNTNMDRKVFRTVGSNAAKSLVPIHTIAYSPADERGPLINLGEISKRSNGTFRWARTTADLKTQLETLADELSKQYVLTFKPDVSSLEGKTFQLVTGSLLSNPLKFGAGFAFGGTGKRGLGWWWVLIVLGVLAAGFGVLVLLAAMRPEKTNFANRQPGQTANPGPVGRRAPAAAPAAAPVAAPVAAAIRSGTLVVVSGALAGQRVTVTFGAAAVTIGKGPSTLQITDDPSVSTRHAQVAAEQAGIVLYDVGSTNGTFVNSQRVSAPTLLSDGDLIRFGNTQVKFRT